MSDWDERLKAAEEGAERLQAAEAKAEERFMASEKSLDSDEFRSWMATRHATDAAWGKWATLMDAKAGA